MGHVLTMQNLKRPLIVFGIMAVGACSSSKADEMSQAKRFAESVVANSFSESAAGNDPPLTSEAQREPRADPAARVAAAKKYGPLEKIRSDVCSIPAQDYSSHCRAVLYICDIRGIAGGSRFAAKVGVCGSLAGQWEVAAYGISYPGMKGADAD